MFITLGLPRGKPPIRTSPFYIMIKSGGAKYYIASYSGDDKRLGMSFAAFTGGVITLTNSDGNFTVEQNKEKSTGDNLVYTLLVKGTKIGSFSMDVKKKKEP